MKNYVRSYFGKIIFVKLLTLAILACFMFIPSLYAQNETLPQTWQNLSCLFVEKSPTNAATASTEQRIDTRDTHSVNLLARVIAGEARGEPYIGKVAVGAVIVNRVHSSAFPNTLSGVVYQPLAFEAVANGQYARETDEESVNAARQVMNGWDPTNGALFFWNPSKPVSPWIWTRTITMRHGNHVFGV